MNYIEYYNNFRERLEKVSNPGLIYCLNEQVGNPGSGVAKSAYLKAIHDQLDLRRIDYSEIGNSQSLSFAKRVLLKDNKLTLMNETIKDKIIFVDTDEFDVTFTTLLIRVDRTIEILGSLQKFQEIYGHNIWTNGRLIILKEMSSPAAELEQMMVEKFIPLGFEAERDFVFLEEQLIYGAGDRVTPYINKPIPGGENIDWLESEVRLDGNFAKFREDEIQST